MKHSLLALAFLIPIPLVSIAGEASEDFSSGDVPASWTNSKGEWVVKEGALSGKELESDSHAAVLTIPDPHVTSSITFRFQVNGAKAFHLSYNKEKGHLFRVRLNKGEIALVMDKDKKDRSSKPVVLEKAKLPLEAGKWYELTCQVSADKARVTCGEVVLSGKHPDLKKEKTGYRLIVQGDSVLIDDVIYTSSM